MSTSPTSLRTVTLPSARVFVGAVYAICVLGMIAVFVGVIVFTDQDPLEREGPIRSIIGVGILGTAALLIVIGMGLWQALPPTGHDGCNRARSLVPAHLDRVLVRSTRRPRRWCRWARRPDPRAAAVGRAAGSSGIVEVFIALLNVVLSVGAVLLSGTDVSDLPHHGARYPLPS